MRALATSLMVALSLISVPSFSSEAKDTLKIGVLNDQSGPYADLGGQGSVIAARMAVEDFGGSVLGRKVEVVFADHQNKPDVGSQVARRWFDTDGVEAVVDLPNSAVALSVAHVAKERNKVVMYSGSIAASLTGEHCGATTSQWAYDAYALAKVTGGALVKREFDTWFFITLSSGAGPSIEADAAAVVKEMGGKVLGSVKHPLGTMDFSSFVLQAQASGAKVVALANAGADTINAVKSAAQFGLTSNQKIVGMLMQVNDIHGLGLEVTQGVITAESFYWDTDESTRAFTKRFMQRHKGTPPNQLQAGVYSSVLHYLRAVAAVKSTDGAVVTKKMKELPVNDFYSKDVVVREDGRVMRDFFLMQVKAPDKSKGPWDYYDVLARVPGAEVYRPLEKGGCPLVMNK